MVEIGIMQGRLLPPFKGRFQAFPASGWEEEFPRAAAAGLACIEWIYEKPGEQQNPFRTSEGQAVLKSLSAKHQVGVRSICADYYMTELLVADDGTEIEENISHLEWLLGQARTMDIQYIVLPFVDSSSALVPARLARLADLMRTLAPRAEQAGVELHLETDLPPEPFRDLLQAVDSPWIRANYDIGNSSGLGYDPVAEFDAYGSWIGSLHVKDRVLGGGTVPLGTGNADIPKCLGLLHKYGFKRWLILQAARDESRDHVDWARENRMFVEAAWPSA